MPPPGTREVGAATIEVSSSGHPAVPPGAVRRTAVLITVELLDQDRPGVGVGTDHI
jgi:hypothetical protein